MSFDQHIFVATDVVAVTKDRLVLLIRRKNEPYKGMWAFPGGFLEEEEEVEAGAVRELWEETRLLADPSDLHFVGAFGKVGRDPRFRTISLVYRLNLISALPVEGKDDAAEAKWHSLDQLPNLAFDHRAILDGLMYGHS
jgi:8-oxo-dGTP diphosphatase